MRSGETPEPFVSVVSPFYNTDAYLAECIESVLAQTHQAFEYLLVDNQSTDRSGEIAASYARRDPRIRVIRTPRFFSQVQNYNFALQQISKQSRYCKMVQADDWIFPRCLTEMVALAEAHPTAAVVSSYNLWGTRVNATGLSPRDPVIRGREACRLHLVDGVYLFGSPTVIMYRADLVRARTPFYEEGRLFEDGEVVYDLMQEHDVGFVHQILSFVRRQEDSIWGATEAYDPVALVQMVMLHRYGPKVLSPDEYARTLRETEGRYYRMLARGWLARKEPGFWKFHRDGLANVGLELRMSEVYRHAVPGLLEAVVPPALSRRLVTRFPALDAWMPR